MLFRKLLPPICTPSDFKEGLALGICNMQYQTQVS